MQDRKGDFKEFMKTLKEKVRDWGVRDFLETIILHFSLLFVFTLLCYCIFTYYNLFHTDVDSARYMLSALVQSQAAIIAIVISLTLIAVQLTASSYSPRVIDIFKSPKKNPDFWVLLGFYCSSIIYGLFILKQVAGAEGEAVSQSAIWSLGRFSISFELGVSFAYWLGAFTFVILFLYMWRIMTLLKPEYIIDRLAVGITKKNLNPLEEDPIQPIMDIVHGSIMKYDLATTRIGLGAVTEGVIKVIDSDREEWKSMLFCEPLERVAKLAVSRMDEESTVAVIKSLEEFGDSKVPKGLNEAVFQAAKSLGEVGRVAAEKELSLAAETAVMSLGRVGELAACLLKLKNATSRIAKSLAEVGEAAAIHGLEKTAEQAVKYLEEIGRTAVMMKHNEEVVKKVVMSLIRVGDAAAIKSLVIAPGHAEKSLAQLTILAEDIVRPVIQDYKPLFIDSYKQELEKLQAEK